MFKIVWLTVTLAIVLPLTFPANATVAQSSGATLSPECLSVKQLSAGLMGAVFSIDPQVVGVSVKAASKEYASPFIHTDTSTNTAEMSCTMTWLTYSDNVCQSVLGTLHCSNTQGRQDVREADEKIQKSLDALDAEELEEKRLNLQKMDDAVNSLEAQGIEVNRLADQKVQDEIKEQHHLEDLRNLSAKTPQ